MSSKISINPPSVISSSKESVDYQEYQQKFLTNTIVGDTPDYIFNAVLAILIFIVTFPISCWVAWKLYLEGSQPIIFAQTRVGLRGKLFKIYKFRTMNQEVTKLGPFITTSYDDPRITKFGRFLRSKKLDEIPQLINIIKGEMSFVGPRPEVPFFHEENTKKIKNWEWRITVKPGITGLAQLYCNDTHNPAHKIGEDLRYVAHKSFSLDIKILWETFLAVIKGRKL